MIKRLKVAFLFVLKWVGIFHLCRFLRRRKLQILCYHGIALKDEHGLDDFLFMRPETFRRRLQILKRWGVNVISLDDAVKALPEGSYPDHSAVITLDDGWYSTLIAADLLREFNYSSVVYVSSSYIESQTPVFNVLMRYLYWKNGAEGWEEACMKVLLASQELDSAAHWKLICETAGRFGIDPEPLVKSRMFHYMSAAELRKLPALGMNLELHTHNHRFPMDQQGAKREVTENRAALQRILPGEYAHFCFPGGKFDDRQLPWLKELGIRSATTTKFGSNDSRSPILKLNRFLDRDLFSDLEFEAKLCGLSFGG